MSGPTVAKPGREIFHDDELPISPRALRHWWFARRASDRTSPSVIAGRNQHDDKPEPDHNPLQTSLHRWPAVSFAVFNSAGVAAVWASLDFAGRKEGRIITSSADTANTAATIANASANASTYAGLESSPDNDAHACLVASATCHARRGSSPQGR